MQRQEQQAPTQQDPKSFLNMLMMQSSQYNQQNQSLNTQFSQTSTKMANQDRPNDQTLRYILEYQALNNKINEMMSAKRRILENLNLDSQVIDNLTQTSNCVAVPNKAYNFNSESDDNDKVSEDSQPKKRKYNRTIPHSKRNFRCPIQGCSRNYCSEPSLILHLKLKHPGAELPSPSEKSHSKGNTTPSSTHECN
mmetsp:Transcript_7126/g.6403  ORF Transcript_7126/g.6403 Transcript_7126/m.6403 type:complete len:195 (+) Transcript_7126:221-805(+)